MGDNPQPGSRNSLEEPLDALKQVPAWYDLDRYARYRDPILVLGFGFVVYGVSRWTVPGAEVLMGTGLMAVGYLMSL